MTRKSSCVQVADYRRSSVYRGCVCQGSYSVCRKAANCQPNFRKAVHPDPTKSCGPYKPLSRAELSSAPLRKRDEGAALPRGLQEEDHLKRELLHHSQTGMQLETQSAPAQTKHLAICLPHHLIRSSDPLMHQGVLTERRWIKRRQAACADVSAYGGL